MIAATRPCPFCSETNVIPHAHGFFTCFICEHCGARGPIAASEEVARIRWNRRRTTPLSQVVDTG
jgi:ribosomal protein L37AE/L43A